MAKIIDLNRIESSQVDHTDYLYLAHNTAETGDPTYEDFKATIQDVAHGINSQYIAYDNTTSGLSANNVKTAIDELAAGGREVLNDLTDVSISTPAANQLLQYNSTTEKWENKKYIEGTNNTVTGTDAHAEGNGGNAIGDYSHIEGYHYPGARDVLGHSSHAEGFGTISIGGHSHAEGGGCKAYGYESHAEGAGTTAEGIITHVEGAGNIVVADRSHIEGGGNRNAIFAECGHVEGAGNVLYDEKGHIEGCGNTGSGIAIHIEGAGNYIRGEKSHAEGGGHNYFGYGAHIEGKHNSGVGSVNHIEGANNKIGVTTLPSQFNPYSTYAIDDIVAPNAAYISNVEFANGIYKCITAPGTIQPQQGVEIITPTVWDSTLSYTAGSVVKYNNTYYYNVDNIDAGIIPSGTSSQTGSGWQKIYEILSPFKNWIISSYGSYRYYLLNCNANLQSLPSGETGQPGETKVARITGNNVIINAMWEEIPVSQYCHLEGQANTVLGDLCHAEGAGNTVNSNYAHVEGIGNIASSDYQHVGGKYNIEDNQGTYAEIIGNGTYDSTVTPAVTTRSNARTLDWSGNEMIAGDLTFMGSKSLNTMLPDPPAADGTYTLQCTVLNGVATYAWV